MEAFLLAVGPWPAHLALLVASLPLSLIDLREHRLPDRIVLPLFAASAAYFLFLGQITAVEHQWVRAVGVMAMGIVVLWLMAEAPGQPLGFGDVKLGGMLAMHLGWHSGLLAVFGVMMAFIFGGMWVVWCWLRHRLAPGDEIAFGPWLMVGFTFALLAHHLGVEATLII